MKQHILYNDSLCDADAPLLEVGNRGFQFGDGVFETMRAYGGRLFRFDRHIQRLNEGLGVLRCREDLDAEHLLKGIARILAANDLTDANVKVMAFREGGGGPDPLPDAGVSVIVTARAFDHGRKARCEQGLHAHVVSIRRNNYSPVSNIKSINYLDNILGRMEAKKRGTDEALFLNVDGNLAEGSISNIFLVKGGTLVTPPVDAGVLPGITREALIDGAEGEGLNVSVRNVSPDELMGADEAFLTNSLMEVMPLLSVIGKQIGAGTVGEMTTRCMELYRRLVAEELGG